MTPDKLHIKQGILYPNANSNFEIQQNSSAKKYIMFILGFFASADGIVMKNLGDNFIAEMGWNEVKAAYTFQCHMENIHSMAYALQIEALEPDLKKKQNLFDAINQIPCIKQKAEIAFLYMDRSTTSLATRIAAFACVEGIFFAGSFCAFYWLSSKNRMPGLSSYNDLIAKDEGMHTDFACMLYTRFIVNKLNNEDMYKLIDDFVNCEDLFISSAIECDMIGMSIKNMKIYIRFVANRILQQLGYDKFYKNTINPFPFMNKISMERKTNFFEKRPTAYNISSVIDQKDNEFAMTDDF
jgi:ribonucleoside-diphosphate reductase beta chain